MLEISPNWFSCRRGNKEGCGRTVLMWYIERPPVRMGSCHTWVFTLFPMNSADCLSILFTFSQNCSGAESLLLWASNNFYVRQCFVSSSLRHLLQFYRIFGHVEFNLWAPGLTKPCSSDPTSDCTTTSITIILWLPGPNSNGIAQAFAISRCYPIGINGPWALKVCCTLLGASARVHILWCQAGHCLWVCGQ